MKIVIETECGSDFQKKFLDNALRQLDAIKKSFESAHQKNKFNIKIEEN